MRRAERRRKKKAERDWKDMEKARLYIKLDTLLLDTEQYGILKRAEIGY